MNFLTYFNRLCPSRRQLFPHCFSLSSPQCQSFNCLGCVQFTVLFFLSLSLCELFGSLLLFNFFPAFHFSPLLPSDSFLSQNRLILLLMVPNIVIYSIQGPNIHMLLSVVLIIYRRLVIVTGFNFFWSWV